MIKPEKKTYTLQEVKELKEWFDAQTLPQDMQIDKATYTPNLKVTVRMLCEQSLLCYSNPKMQGCLILLEKIKSNLENKQTPG